MWAILIIGISHFKFSMDMVLKRPGCKTKNMAPLKGRVAAAIQGLLHTWTKQTITITASSTSSLVILHKQRYAAHLYMNKIAMEILMPLKMWYRYLNSYCLDWGGTTKVLSVVLLLFCVCNILPVLETWQESGQRRSLVAQSFGTE